MLKTMSQISQEGKNINCISCLFINNECWSREMFLLHLFHLYNFFLYLKFKMQLLNLVLIFEKTDFESCYLKLSSLTTVYAAWVAKALNTSGVLKNYQWTITHLYHVIKLYSWQQLTHVIMFFLANLLK